MALRRPDEFTAPTRLGVEGSHLPATLYHLARTSSDPTLADFTPQGRASAVYARVANRLAQLIADVHDVTVDRDERRELLTLLVTDRDGTIHPARALSDGTLRFLALAVLAEDPETQGVLCLEEPENGIHPARIPAMLHLLQEIATDVRIPIGADNPLRQIIVNTHSPSVVKQVPEESLVVARLLDTVRGDQHFKRVCFSSLNGTWRQKETNGFGVPLGDLLAYLNPDVAEPTGPMLGDDLETKRERRVMDRADLQPMLPQFGDVAPA
jgi:predicted ATPase